MYKVPISVIQECKESLEVLIFHIEENCNLEKESTRKRLKRAKKHIKLLKDNYYV